MKDKDKGLFTEKVNTGERKSLKYVKQAIAEKDEEKRNKIINEKFKLKDTVESIKSSKIPEKVKNIMIDSIKLGNKLDKSDYEKIYEKVNKKKELPKIKNSITKGNDEQNMIGNEQPKAIEGIENNESNIIDDSLEDKRLKDYNCDNINSNNHNDLTSDKTNEKLIWKLKIQIC